MVSKKELEFFKKEKTPEEVFKEFGYQTGEGILKEVIGEGFVDNSKNKKLSLTELGKKKLREFKDYNRRNKKELLLKHPLLTGIILVLLTALLTYIITIETIDYKNELSVRLIGENKIIVPPNQTIQFNGIIIYNPTGKRVSLRNLYVERQINWIKYQPISEGGEEISNESEFIYSIPSLINIYEPYMILESGETKLMAGQFELVVPYREGVYELNFYIETLDGKKYYIDRKLIVEVKLK